MYLLKNKPGRATAPQTESNMKTRLNKKELATIISLSEKLWAMRKKFDEENGTDIELKLKENGTVGSNLDCAVAAIDTILQEYI